MALPKSSDLYVSAMFAWAQQQGIPVHPEWSGNEGAAGVYFTAPKSAHSFYDVPDVCVSMVIFGGTGHTGELARQREIPAFFAEYVAPVLAQAQVAAWPGREDAHHLPVWGFTRQQVRRLASLPAPVSEPTPIRPAEPTSVPTSEPDGPATDILRGPPPLENPGPPRSLGVQIANQALNDLANEKYKYSSGPRADWAIGVIKEIAHSED